MSAILKLVLLSWLCAVVGSAAAQQISIDRGVRAEGLWCFPLVTDSLQYVYLPDIAELATDEKKEPQFSYIRYVNAVSAKPDSTHTSINPAKGGAILHFLVTYHTDEKKIKAAQSSLRELFKNDEIKLRGPLVFKEGHFALVSSILTSDGNADKKVLAMGEAPVLEGSRIALSFELDPQRSKLLQESLMSATPDISIVFDLAFSGLTDAYRAKLTVDWTEVQKYEKMAGGVNVYFVSADLEKVYQELKRTSAIKLETFGNDDRMEPLLNNVYSKLTDLIFKRVEPDLSATSEQNSMGGMLGGLLGAGGGGAGKIFPFSIHAEYKLKDFNTTGSSVLDFNSRVTAERHHFIVFNMGDVYTKFGNNKKFVKTVTLEDPDFLQRDVFVNVDGSIMPEFDKLINNVTVTLRKNHDDGNITVQELNITKAALNDPKMLALSYGAVGDSNRVDWLNYEYQAQFQFKGGRNFVQPWQQQNAAMINVFAPYQRKTIRCEGDMNLLKNKEVRVVIVQLEYPFFGEQRKEEITIHPGDTDTKGFEITLPANQYSYQYNIKWILKNNQQLETNGTNDTEILFVDNLPATL